MYGGCDLIYLVENDWVNFHLKYLEIAQKEYHRRAFVFKARERVKENEAWEKILAGPSAFPNLVFRVDE